MALSFNIKNKGFVPNFKGIAKAGHTTFSSFKKTGLSSVSKIAENFKETKKSPEITRDIDTEAFINRFKKAAKKGKLTDSIDSSTSKDFMEKLTDTWDMTNKKIDETMEALKPDVNVKLGNEENKNIITYILIGAAALILLFKSKKLF